MKNLAIAGALLLLGVGIALLLRARAHRGSVHRAQGYDTYLGLRNLALQTSRTQIGLAPPSSVDEPWGVIMDWGMDAGTATVVAFSDGSASVYLSSGGGFIGGGQSGEAVRKAAKVMVTAAADFRRQTHATTVYPLPRNGEVFFYLLTDRGVFTASAPEAELRGGSHPLSRLGNAAQNVITQCRHMRP